MHDDLHVNTKKFNNTSSDFDFFTFYKSIFIIS